jgi:hypothetical protein
MRNVFRICESIEIDYKALCLEAYLFGLSASILIVFIIST